ncbi:acetolactate decarboxylase [Granulosicoccus antarcticus]|uniref:Alpha-acetolactate decarboxylase n=1 Tax=Granulosicoccus antarcticus IMCC3135 TaxID=1192854 RepID=A0A2Z2NWC5_9GAMM|nr:acetolactate decarboxylase [Granulosicoccus antarcticus]ASJ75732.1 Alpha-acetolactate decarboxylase [Granulosicoccus antarcticus IMCC3135]
MIIEHKNSLLAAATTLAALLSISNASAHESHEHNDTQATDSVDDRKAIEQYGLPLTLMNTIYEGQITAAEMKSLGNLGVGVSNHLNGELTAVDGVVYSIAADGTATVAPDDLQAPYMSMIDFEPTRTITISDINSFKDLEQAVLANITSANTLHVFKAKGLFSFTRLASAHGVEDENVDFFEYLGSRQMYDLEQTEGTIVGIYTPAYLGTVSIPGLHFHFQNGDNTIGGHMEDIRFDQLQFEVQEVDRINLALPNVQKFRDIDMKMIQPPSGAGAGGSDKKE